MNKNRNLDHEFLDLRAEDQLDRTFMGGWGLAGRVRLFVAAGVVAAAALVGLYAFVDRNAAEALDGWARAEEAANLVARLGTGVAGARGEEKRFLLEKDPVIALGFERSLAAALGSLDRLSRMPESAPQRQHIATVRDGLAQYDQHFTKLVDQEKTLGLTDGSGLSGQLKTATEDLQAKFSTAGYANLAGQVARINQEGHETLLSGYKVGVEEIQKRYQTLAAFLEESKLPPKRKAELKELLARHETNMLAMINARFAFDDESARFDEIIAYLAPSMTALDRATGLGRAQTAETLADVRRLARAAVAGGAAIAVLALIAVGLLVMGSVNRSVRRVAAAAGRLADGDRSVAVPARGNADAVGAIARALDRWLDNLADLEQLRQELDQTRSRLETALAETETAVQAAAETARVALMGGDADADAEAEAAPRGGPSRYAGLPDVDGGGQPGAGPLSSVSRQLASFSEYVTAAANDVERTEALIRGLGNATREIEEMTTLVTAIRDQTNLLAFRSGPRDAGPDNVVVLTGDERALGDDADALAGDMAKRVDAIRDATDRAERTAQSARLTVADVTRMAQEIAATASEQALEATSKLLSQSEYLQNMLDDVISKIQPAPPGAMTEKAEPAGKAGKAKKSKKSKDGE